MAVANKGAKKGTKRADRWVGDAENNTFSGLGGDDYCDGGKGKDNVDGGSGDDTIKGGAGNDKLLGGKGDDTIDGGAGNDRIDGGSGDDTINGGSGNDTINGGAGDDNINGGSGRDEIDGGDGNDLVAGGTGDDIMIGGKGIDTLFWGDGDGSDIISGGEDRDTVVAVGDAAKGDNLVLGSDASDKAIFDRVGKDGQPIAQIRLTVDTVEVFDVRGEGGNDTFEIQDLTGTGVEEILFLGGEGNDILDARATSTHVTADGGAGDDVLIGGTGTIVNPNNVTLGDTLTGGAGKDTFQFSTDPFANGNPAQNLNQPDVITDYEQGKDRIVFDPKASGVDVLKFQKGDSTKLAGDSNMLVLTDGFANAAAAAAAIAVNDKITAGKGFFSYFNTTLGISRVVFSNDLGKGGTISVQANLNNLTELADQNNFAAADFVVGDFGLA
jgi:Ca2+-binding RTX toxin-like protein